MTVIAERVGGRGRRCFTGVLDGDAMIFDHAMERGPLAALLGSLLLSPNSLRLCRQKSGLEKQPQQKWESSRSASLSKRLKSG